ncbi:RagB/SusD family nutrient uptake outer membrane protein [Pedobacter nutrimenti]|uniref:RagB/SusD family nutrient uptake outer membrane protein n=1 Tax=Pedobacter nutrimenti TaxID=1241337 RepID=UPI002930C0A5|nr:RagB/SusD family nutrient uptake outer membrane protein [Pedobacter nutrimenti]
MKKYIMCILLVLGVFSGCKKFLDPKPLQSLTVPSNLEDLQALLDDEGVINSLDISAGEISSDDYYLTRSDLESLPYEEYRRMYTWQNDRIFRPATNDWSSTYRIVFSTNVVLDNLSKIERTSSNQTQWENIKGQALFIRAKQFFCATLTWAPAYDPATADRDPGVPLRSTQDFNVPSLRATVSDCYKRITEDLILAGSLLSDEPLAKTRASKAAAWGLLARVYLSMGDYENCLKYADLYLQERNGLMDYNKDINVDLRTPFPRFNKEVCFDSFQNHMMLSQSRAKVDYNLYSSYDDNDLRKSAFFRKIAENTFCFKGNYSLGIFGGIATDEVYLMRAECRVRKGDAKGALSDLNALLFKRWKTGTLKLIANENPKELLGIILIERRKELIMRGLRWMDVKRLNKQGAGIVLKRSVDGKNYELPANDHRYALSIPEDVLVYSGMAQNER